MYELIEKSVKEWKTLNKFTLYLDWPMFELKRMHDRVNRQRIRCEFWNSGGQWYNNRFYPFK